MPFGGLLTVGLIGAGTGIFSGILGSKASKDASKAQVDASNHAADLQKQEADAALAFQKDVFGTEQANAAPWLSAGKTALGQLSEGTAPGGPLVAPFNPNSVDVHQDPGYQFRLSEGLKALDRSAAARGNATGGGQMKAITRYGQDYASNEYGNAYNRAFNSFETNQGNAYNRLAGIAGTGQTAVGQLNSAGQNAAGNVTNIDLGTGSALSNLIVGAGNARASGYVGSANAWSNAFGGASSSFSNMLLLSRLLNGGGGGNTFSPPPSMAYSGTAPVVLDPSYFPPMNTGITGAYGGADPSIINQLP